MEFLPKARAGGRYNIRPAWPVAKWLGQRKTEYKSFSWPELALEPGSLTQSVGANSPRIGMWDREGKRKQDMLQKQKQKPPKHNPKTTCTHTKPKNPTTERSWRLSPGRENFQLRACSQLSLCWTAQLKPPRAPPKSPFLFLLLWIHTWYIQTPFIHT